MDHPNIIRFYEACEDLDNYFLVLELCTGGELFQKISDNGKFSEADAKHIFKQIIEAVNYCHINGIVHRGLTLEDILYINTE